MSLNDLGCLYVVHLNDAVDSIDAAKVLGIDSDENLTLAISDKSELESKLEQLCHRDLILKDLKHSESLVEKCLSIDIPDEFEIRSFRELFPQHVSLLNSKKSNRLSTKDSSLEQIAKDVGRDSFVINGESYLGSAGLEGLLSLLKEEIMTAAMCLGVSDVSEDVMRTISLNILQMGNRTRSGGDTFIVLRNLLQIDSLHDIEYLLIADSQAAFPVTIDIDHGPYYAERWNCGLRIKIVAGTSYFLSRNVLNDEPQKLCRINAAYTRFGVWNPLLEKADFESVPGFLSLSVQ